MKSRVFVVQVPARREQGEWVEKYDLSPAEEHGELVRVLPYGNVPTSSGGEWQRFREVANDFDPQRDFVLLLGDPVACARFVHFLCYMTEGSTFMALKWDRRAGCYVPCEVG